MLVLSNLRADHEYDGEAIDEHNSDDVIERSDRRLAAE